MLLRLHNELFIRQRLDCFADSLCKRWALSDLIYIQNVSHSDGFPECFFFWEKLIKKTTSTKKKKTKKKQKKNAITTKIDFFSKKNNILVPNFHIAVSVTIVKT